MIKKGNYEYELIKKENMRLLRENESLREQIDEISNLKDEYHKLIDELKDCRKKYQEAYENFSNYENEMKQEMLKLLR